MKPRRGANSSSPSNRFSKERSAVFDDLRYRTRALLHRKRTEEELDEELRFHFDRRVEKYRGSGFSELEAKRQARLLFGGHEQVKEKCQVADASVSTPQPHLSFSSARLPASRFLLAAISAYGVIAFTALRAARSDPMTAVRAE